jgi:hypothetical protein
MSQAGGRWRLKAGFGCEFQCVFEGRLNFSGGFLAGIAVGHDVGPLDDLRDVAIVTGRR